MKILSLPFIFFLLILLGDFALCWMEWTDSNQVASTNISTLLYASGASFVSWSQNDADSLCAVGTCGPYCNYTSTTCNGTSQMDLTTIPSPSGLTDANTSCADYCCSVENCLRTINADGVDIGISKQYVLIFGGRQVSAADDTTLLFDFCEVDGLQVSNNGSCLGTASNTLTLVDLSGGSSKTVVPVTNTDVTVINSVSSPSARYGQKSVFISRSYTDSATGYNYTRKFLYVYGGYSADCGGYCSDFWRYEIPWAPQRYYPEGTGYWNRGNYWEQINSTTGPGKRAWFSLTSDDIENIYLFGGALELPNGTRIYTNDLWCYSISKNTWTQIGFKKIVSAIRSVRLWDGSWGNIAGDVNQMNSGDIKTIQDLPLVPCVADSRVPPCRAFSTLACESGQNWLILSGGYISNSTVQGYMSYVWTFDLTRDFPVWSQYDTGSDQILTPGAPAFAARAFISTSSYRLYFFFGGIVSQYESRDGLWAYDFTLNKSTQLNPQPLSSTQTYPQLNKGMTLVPLTLERGLFLIGGYLRNTLTPSQNLTKTQYLAECQSVFTAAGFQLSDCLTTAWSNYYTTSQNTCFDPTRTAFFTIENQFTISDKKWTYMQSYCRLTDSSYGTCFWGRANCSSDRYGADCSNLQCINSLCYQEKTSLTEAVCIHCYARGSCVNGECQCDDGYTFDDCSGVDCPNNCSNTATLTVATCVLRYPLSVCQCERETKRGGDDCSYIFCLNDCGGHGTCNAGTCVCDTNYYGLDCSIFDITFIEDSSPPFLQVSFKLFALLFLLTNVFLI